VNSAIQTACVLNLEDASLILDRFKPYIYTTVY